jgi:sRNA-binding carbon storage regulator CsrA
MYVGRDIHIKLTRVAMNGVVLEIQRPWWVEVSDSDLEFSEHMEAQALTTWRACAAAAETDGATICENRRGIRARRGNEAVRGEFVVLKDGGLWIGRGIEIDLVEVMADGFAKIRVEAPRTDAVTRDSFSFAEHLEFQASREAGNETIPGRSSTK